MSDYNQRVYDAYDEWIDEAHEIVSVGASQFYPSRVLSNCDPIAYAEGLENWLDWLHHTMRSFCYECERFDVCHCGEDFDEDGVRICTPTKED